MQHRLGLEIAHHMVQVQMLLQFSGLAATLVPAERAAVRGRGMRDLEDYGRGQELDRVSLGAVVIALIQTGRKVDKVWVARHFILLHSILGLAVPLFNHQHNRTLTP